MPQRSHAKPQRSHYEKYRAFLLRIWRETHHSSWRISVESLDMDEERRFSDLDGLMNELKRFVEEMGG